MSGSQQGTNLIGWIVGVVRRHTGTMITGIAYQVPMFSTNPEES